ncbi:unnamed protein product [Lactuca saligna]|uniref:Uncharacterized protein n=1 Tax=Lactuca saligna TaxID=75948 RepID=A0AA35ZIU3_LACSI|nr:unnamed protein product [Lactuca saligna]
MALGTLPSSRNCGGHWVTRLAQSYKQWRIPDDDFVTPIRQMEPEHIHKPTFVRRQRHRYVKIDREPTLNDFMQRIDVLKEGHRWSMASISSIMVHPGMDHPPFLQVGSVVCRDVAGPSRTQQGGYDDSEEDT